MAKGYQCLDCSYRSDKGFPGGRCPGCGSARIRRVGQPEEEQAPPPARRSFRIALLVFLWVFFFYQAWRTWTSMH